MKLLEGLRYHHEDLRHRYYATLDIGYVYVALPLDDDGSDEFHPFYEIERRSIAVAALRTGLSRLVIEA